ncbi:MAG: ABC transporter ATP-binding protein, partial [Bacteroidales bacterium]|nr:ABC transporter ATP-binding protein [Bacteroidales bacterium]
QRSQVALGLLMAQNPKLLILDDFSLGLDPGYRRLFIDYLRDFVKSSGKTVFLTSHIIQDMERLIDDCIMMDYGKIILQMPVDELLGKYRQYNFRLTENSTLPEMADVYHPTVIRGNVELGSFLDADELKSRLVANGVAFEDFTSQKVNLEDAFIGLTGKY